MLVSPKNPRRADTMNLAVRAYRIIKSFYASTAHDSMERYTELEGIPGLDCIGISTKKVGYVVQVQITDVTWRNSIQVTQAMEVARHDVVQGVRALMSGSTARWHDGVPGMVPEGPILAFFARVC